MAFRVRRRPWALLILAVSMLVAGGVASAVPGEITTFAGGWTDDGSPAVKATLRWPYGVAVAPDGSILIADFHNNRIREVDPSGIISTVAGNGSSGFSGDGGSATQASLYYPSDVALALDGSIFIADTGNKRIRKVDPEGTISTVAGNGSSGFSGDGGPATQASLDPEGVAVAPDGSILIADRSNNRIRKVDPAGTISTVAGYGSGGFAGDGGPATQAALYSPQGVAVAPDGSIFIADGSNYRIRKVDPSGTISTVAGNGNCCSFSGDGGPATQASLYPQGVAVAPDGSILIADSGNNRIRQVDPAGIISTVAGDGGSGFSGDGGPATQAALDPSAVAVAPDGSIFIADPVNHRVRKVDPDGIISTVAGGSWVGAVALELSLYRPQGVAVGPDGSAYIADTEDYRVLRIAPDGSAEVVAGNGSRCDYYSQCKDGAATEVALQGPTGIAVDPDGVPYIADGYRVLKVENGVVSTVAGTGGCCSSVDNPVIDGTPARSASIHADDVVITDFGVLYIADSNANRVYKVVDGTISTVAGGGVQVGSPVPVVDGIPAPAASLYNPKGLALGPDGSLFIADTYNNRVRKVDPDGTISTVAGRESCCSVAGNGGPAAGDGGPATQASLYHPEGVAVAPDGSIFIADTDNHRIRKVNPRGIITTAAGTGAQGFSGDGGSAIRATLSSPRTIALTPDGSFLIADTGNDRIRRVTPDTADGFGPTVSFADTAPVYSSQSAVTGAILDDDSGVATARVILSPASGLARGHMLSGDELACDGARKQCSFGVSLSGVSPGVYDVSVTARDVAGNQGGATKKIVVVG